MIDIFAKRDPREQTGGGVAARHGPRRRGRKERRAVAIQAVPELWPHDHALEELRRRHIDLEGALLADPFVKLRLRPHGRRDDLHGLLHGQVREGLRRQRALRRWARGPLVGDCRGRPFDRSEFLQLPELQAQLRRVQPLAPARPEELALEPRDLRPQGRDLLPEGGDLFGRGGEDGHAVS